MIGAWILVAATATAWYGPVEVRFDNRFDGNPFDPAVNDVKVRFVSGPNVYERIAFYDNGVWRAKLVAGSPGTYVATLYRNGVPLSAFRKEVRLTSSRKLKTGFVMISRRDRTRFALDSGKPFLPIGMNLAWTNPTVPDLPAQIESLGKAGVNWVRVWACNWDGKNPYFPTEGSSVELGRMWEPALAKWDAIVASAEKSGVRVQLTFFNHGSFSSTVNPNWQQHPWNSKNGGFLESAIDFFTDPLAKKLSKQWLRTAVARWGDSPSIFAWELFNEVEWVDASIANRWDLIAAWHSEMANYIKGIDPYHHLVTTSSRLDQRAMWTALDFYNPHGYPPSVKAMVAGQPVPNDKPMFFGEFGGDQFVKEKERGLVRDGIWTSVLSGHGGAAMYWYWDRAKELGLISEFSRATKALSLAKFVDRVGLKPVKLDARTQQRTTLELSPGRGWAKTERFSFNLPGDATPGAMGMVSGYLYSQNSEKKEMLPRPLSFTFDAPQGGKAVATFNEVAAQGATVQLIVNGTVAKEYTWTALENRRQPPVTIEAKLAKGANVVQLASIGADWAKLKSITLSGAGYAANAMALGSKRFALVRVTAEAAASIPIVMSVRGLPLVDGAYKVTQFDLDSGATKTATLKVKGGAVSALTLSTRDAVLIVGS